jgi:hypothetical protein
VNHDTAEQWQLGFHLLPNPTREVLASWILQTGNFVEIVMVETVERGLKSDAYVREVHDPTRAGVDLTGEMQLDPK